MSYHPCLCLSTLFIRSSSFELLLLPRAHTTEQNYWHKDEIILIARTPVLHLFFFMLQGHIICTPFFFFSFNQMFLYSAFKASNFGSHAYDFWFDSSVYRMLIVMILVDVVICGKGNVHTKMPPALKAFLFIKKVAFLSVPLFVSLF